MRPFRFWRWVPLVILMTVQVFAGPARAERVRCPATKDVWLSAAGEEADCSMGLTDRIKLKVLQELGLMAFDVSALRGRTIRAANLYLYPADSEQPVLIPDRPTPLRWVVVSTVSSHWQEGLQDQSYKTDPKGHGATFNEASYQVKPWCWPGSTVAFVTSGHLNSFYSVGEIVPTGDGYWRVPVDVPVVEALVAGLGDGVSVIDGSSTHTINAYVYSRQAPGKEPYLLVDVEEKKEHTPAAAQIVAVKPDLEHALPETGAMAITVKTPKDAFGFYVKIDGSPMEPWQVELPRNPGGEDVITLEDLPAGKKVKVAVAVVDRAGNVSEWVEASGTVSDKVTVPPLPAFPFAPAAGEPAKAGKNLSVWALPEMVEIDPVAGVPLFENQDLRKANAVYSGKEHKVRVAAARGEIAAFQLAIENVGKACDVHVGVESLASADDATLRGVHLSRVWYVKAGAGDHARWNAEYAIPLTAAVDIAARDLLEVDPLPPSHGVIQIPPKDNNILNQALQAVYVDIVVPTDAAAGTYKGNIKVKGPDGEAVLPLEVVVYPVTIPATLNFNPELDCYHSPGGPAGTKPFFDYHRVAHYNRCTINEISHTQTGQVWRDMIPVLGGDGATTHVKDWTGYDKRVGPLLDGSAFAHLPRDGVPVRTFYLPFGENWPMPLEGHYQMNRPPPPPGRSFLTSEDPPDGETDFDWKEIHDLTAKPIEQAFDEAYKKGFERVTTDFVKHFDAKGWTYTYVQMYQNNKYPHHGQWWTLDEPSEWLDWAALTFWADLLHKGMKFPHEAKFVYRGDISRLQWQGAFMDGKMDVAYSGGDGLKWPRLLRHIRERTGMMTSIYGTCNAVARSNLESAAWCLKAYSVYVDGVLPWASLGRDHALFEPDDNGLLIEGGRFRLSAVPSLRILALRHGAQQCELLRQVVASRKGWSRWHGAALVAQKVALETNFHQAFRDEAAAAKFQPLTGTSFVELKEGLLQMLSDGEALP